MLIWSGRGWLAAVLIFVCSLIMNHISNTYFGGPQYWEIHSWPFGIAMLAAAVICWMLGSYVFDQKGRLLIDKETGEETILKPSNSLFFIEIHWWGPILLVIGLYSLIKEAL